ncbi:unnamed protein product [Mytilus edulis]|uniref:C-type lectin domain-containing protein n=1 Tax=Mytilus edulis TaxID=6550 RepID=A0A8S3TLV1_MYTED|nr:unnamed protein product [Mytilus edulis]
MKTSTSALGIHKQMAANKGISFCRTYNSHLATVETGGENAFLTDTIELIKNGIGKRDIDDRDFWLGGTDEVIEGVWVWAPTGKDLTYTNWLQGNPDNWNTNENCLELVLSHDVLGKWNDQECSFVSHFICEMDSKQPQTQKTVHVDNVKRRIHSETACQKKKKKTGYDKFQAQTTTETGKSALRYHMQKKTMNFMYKTNTGYDKLQAPIQTITETGKSARKYHK